MLAMEVNDNAAILNERGVFEFFASKLAPTTILIPRSLSEHVATLPEM